MPEAGGGETRWRMAGAAPLACALTRPLAGEAASVEGAPGRDAPGKRLS